MLIIIFIKNMFKVFVQNYAKERAELKVHKRSEKLYLVRDKRTIFASLVINSSTRIKNSLKSVRKLKMHLIIASTFIKAMRV